MTGLKELTVQGATSLADAHAKHRWTIPADYNVAIDCLDHPFHKKEAVEPIVRVAYQGAGVLALASALFGAGGLAMLAFRLRRIPDARALVAGREAADPGEGVGLDDHRHTSLAQATADLADPGPVFGRAGGPPIVSGARLMS